MPLEIIKRTFGPVQNNTFILVDSDLKQAVVIDPAFRPVMVNADLQRNQLRLSAIWITHAHFDHLGGVESLLESHPQPIQVGLHPADLPLWQAGAGAELFGQNFSMSSEPNLSFADGQILNIGVHTVKVLHTPGHSPGHVVFYIEELSTALVGDLIFRGGVGRTDLPGGDSRVLLQSIEEKILTLPAETALLPGHGPSTTVEMEKKTNPYLNGYIY
jgi:glyoxylase-like metal-dependent hydrolase (beta-lactamase superfamily II)